MGTDLKAMRRLLLLASLLIAFAVIALGAEKSPEKTEHGLLHLLEVEEGLLLDRKLRSADPGQRNPSGRNNKKQRGAKGNKKKKSLKKKGKKRKGQKGGKKVQRRKNGGRKKGGKKFKKIKSQRKSKNTKPSNGKNR